MRFQLTFNRETDRFEAPAIAGASLANFTLPNQKP